MEKQTPKFGWKDKIGYAMGLTENDIIKSFSVDRGGVITTYTLDRYFDLGDYLFCVRSGDTISFTVIRNGLETVTANYSVSNFCGKRVTRG